MKFLNIFLSLAFSFSLSYAALYKCPGDKLNLLDGATASVTQNTSGTIGANTTNYYHFTSDVDGVIQVNSSMNASYNTLAIKKGCNINLWIDSSNSNNKSSAEVSVKAGEEIVISYERRYGNSKEFELQFNFKYIDYALSTNQRNFTIRNPVETRNIKGNIKVIGNTVLCYKNNKGVCVDTDKSNNGVSLSFIDTDGVNYTYNNSSQAQIANIPSTAKVKWAGFYTQGYLKTNQTNTISALTNTPTYLTTPQGSTIALKNDAIDLNPYKNNEYTYATFTEVTALKGLSGSEVNGWYTGANIKALEGRDSGSLGYFGAWTLVLVYEDDSETLKNISVFDGYKEIGSSNDTIKVSGFYTPTSGDVKSTLSVFVGEGDKSIKGDDITLENVSLSPSGTKNAFNSTVNGFNTNPDPVNYQGIDIHNYDVGKDGDLSHLQIIGNGVKSATIGLVTTGDYYYPSMVAFTTELYEPRVCYKQEFFNINGNIIEDIKVGDTIAIHTWISNMKKDSADANLETAEKVKITVDLDSENLEYVSGTLEMKNVYENNYIPQTDTKNNGLAEFDFDKNSTMWRVGKDATSTDGGELTPNFANTNGNKAFVKFKVKLLKDGDINIQNKYRVSYSNSQLGLRFGDESPINIGVCADMNTSLGVGGILGKFNVVNESGGNGSFKDPASPQTWLTTQVVNKPFTVKIISLNDTGDALKNYNGDVELSLISNPYDGTCGNDDVCKQLKCANAPSVTGVTNVTINGSSVNKSVTYNTAQKNAFFKISYDGGTKFACSVDSFSIRPDKINLTVPAGEDIELLNAGKVYNLSLIAQEYANTNPSTGYNIANAQSIIDLEKTIFNPDGSDGSAALKGELAFSTAPFHISNGSALDVVGINFSDVGKVNIKMIDKTWAASDIANGDTVESCDPEGAWICGDINATFIPSGFALSAVSLNNSDNNNFTYLSNDLNMSAPIGLTIAAQNTLGVVTENFTSTAWENPVDISIVVPTKSGMVARKSEIDATQKLGFTNGALTIPWNETNSSKQLSFNYPRDIDSALNPFEINGSVITLNATSTYTASVSGATKDVAGTNTAENSATFVYGRSHAPRQRYTNNSGRALIYFEAYCFGTDANGVICDKTLLPNGLNSRNTNDLRWFINSQHDTNHGVIGNVVEKNALGRVNPTMQTGVKPVIVDMTYDESQGYPYKTTMENNASSWLIHNEHNALATKNQFSVEFSKASSEWSGKHETDTTTNDHNATNTNRRSMW